MISVSICSPTMDVAAAWADLAKRAPPNVFMSPAALMAANETGFAQGYVMLAWQQGASPGKLLGVWALQLRKIVPFWPAVLEALPYNYAFLSSPVIDPAFVDEVVPAFLAAIEKDPALPNVINLPSFNAESPDYGATMKALAARGGEQFRFAESARPMVTRESGVKRSGSTRKKLRQDWNRLSALGAVGIVNARAPEGGWGAFGSFPGLGAGGWEGPLGPGR